MPKSNKKIASFSSIQKELVIRGEPVQRIYNFYINNRFYVNRRYQRKLVWTVEEKTAFIDSIFNGFPVPIILLAETKRETENDEFPVFEIIDGMQRLNAVISFVEGEFDFQGKYFDLQTMVESKSLLDQGRLNQKEPILERKICEMIASYVMPLSVYSFSDNEKVDEIFRRINSNGKHLSKQELRSAGSTTTFANLVRLISAEIRTDTSASDILPLNNMKEISITNKQLEYGIIVSDIFWVNNNILTKEMLRDSRDEEIVANILADILLNNVASSASMLDQYYGFGESSNQEAIERALAIKQPEVVRNQFITIYNQIRTILQESKKNFRDLICVTHRKLNYTPRSFQIVFLAFYDLIIKDRMEISDYDQLISCLKNINKDIDTPSGPTWSHQNKRRNINKIKGLVRDCFKKRDIDDPATNSWTTEFETLLTQSKTEQSLYDFKQGFTKLDSKKEFDQNSFNKIIKTLTAMANHSPDATGYVCVGVADNDQAVQQIKKLYNIEPIEYKSFKITGIGHEAKILKGNEDDFFRWIIQQINLQPIEQSVKDDIARNIKVINYIGKTVVLFKLSTKESPILYNDKFYQRLGANVDEVKPAELKNLFKRFEKST